VSNDDPTSFNTPDRPSLTSDDVPALGEALLNLTRELWVLTDRVLVLEAVLEKQGISVRDAIDAFEPDEALAAELRKRGTALVAGVMAPFAADSTTE
jgi:hypothetical protein